MKFKLAFVPVLLASSFAHADKYFELAKMAYDTQNYELCLAALQDSKDSDADKTSLLDACRRGLALAQTPAPPLAGPVPAPNVRAYANARAGYSDNVTKTPANQVGRGNDYLGAGAEYWIREPLPFGIGASYEHTDVIQYSGLLAQTYSVYAPLIWTRDQHQLSPSLNYAVNLLDHKRSSTDFGGTLAYTYTLEKYSFTASDALTRRTIQDSGVAYQDGYTNTFNLQAIRFFGALAIGINGGLINARTGDMPYLNGLVPERHNSLVLGGSAAYSFDSHSKLTAKVILTSSSYPNVVAPDGVRRDDTTQAYSLTYLYVFSPQLNAYVQDIFTNNNSSYGVNEIFNCNFNENALTVGLSLATF